MLQFTVYGECRENYEINNFIVMKTSSLAYVKFDITYKFRSIAMITTNKKEEIFHTECAGTFRIYFQSLVSYRHETRHDQYTISVVIGIDGSKLIRLAQDRVQWRAFVNTVMNLRVP